MSVRFPRPLPALVAGLALATLAPAAELGYAFQPGETFTYRVHNVSSPPSQGSIESTADYVFTAAGDDPYTLDADISGSSNRFEMGTPHASFQLTGDGQASGLTSDSMSHPIDGSFVKNAPGLFPHIPAGDLAVGQTWTVQAVLYAPELDLPGSFTQLRTVTEFTYAGTETSDDGKTLHKLTFHVSEKPGERAKMSVDGTTWMDAELGRAVKQEASGYVKVKVSFFWVKVPTSYSLVEVVADEAVLD